MLSKYYINERGEVRSIGKYSKPLGGYLCAKGWTFSDYVKDMLGAKDYKQLRKSVEAFIIAKKCYPLIYLDYYQELYLPKLMDISREEIRRVNRKFNY